MEGPVSRRPDQKKSSAQKAHLYEVKAAIYEGGMAAGLGIASLNPTALKKLLSHRSRVAPLMKELRKAVDDALDGQGISYGIDEEAIQEAIKEFVGNAFLGKDVPVTKKVAAGDPVEEGKSAWLEYPLNPGGIPRHAIREESLTAEDRAIRRVKQGDALIIKHPIEAHKKGRNVGGENVESGTQLKDAFLDHLVGESTTLSEDGLKIMADFDGGYAEDDEGRVRVTRDMVVDEVNYATGNLPRSGIGPINFIVRRGIRKGYGIFTSDSAFVGVRPEGGVVEENTKIVAGNLFVNGGIYGPPLPEEYLTGEMHSLTDEESKQIEKGLERVLVEVEGILVAQECIGRKLSAGTVLIRENCYHSALEADQDVSVDGNLVGGVTSFLSELQVAGNLGNEEGTITRIRATGEAGVERKRKNLQREIQSRERQIEDLRGSLADQNEEIEKRAKKDRYWASLYQGDKRRPSGPVEVNTLRKFYEEIKKRATIEKMIQYAEEGIQDLRSRLQGQEEEGDISPYDFSVTVRGTIYGGTVIEIDRTVNQEDLDLLIDCKIGETTFRNAPLRDVKTLLSKQMNEYIAEQKEQIESRRKAIEQMFKGREKRPKMPTMPRRKFQVDLAFHEEQGEDAPKSKGKAKDLASAITRDARLYAYSNNPGTFYITLNAAIRYEIENVTLALAGEEGSLELSIARNRRPIVPWQQDKEVLNRLDQIEIQELSAKDLLAGRTEVASEI